MDHTALETRWTTTLRGQSARMEIVPTCGASLQHARDRSDLTTGRATRYDDFDRAGLEAGAAEVSDETRQRGLFVGSIVLSAVGVVLFVSWWFGIHRWWMLGVGALFAIGGVAVAARARRDPVEPPDAH
jgi:hypothetical protein